MNKMKKIIVCFLFLLLPMLVSAEQTLYTSGNGYFAVSKDHLKRAIRLDRKGYYEPLNAAISTKRILAPIQGQTVKVDSYKNGIYKVHTPGSKTIWWTTKEALMNRGGENYVK